MSKNYKNRKYKIRKYLKFTRIKRAISSRIISTIITIFVSWAVTGDPLLGLGIGAIDTLIKLFTYYIHESLWEKKITKDIRKIKKKFK